jgi:hypothetical protein
MAGMIAPRSSSHTSRQRAWRDALLVALALLVAVLAVGAGYAVTRKINLPFGLPSLGAQHSPTPVPTLNPLQAIAQIEHIYPEAQARFISPLLQETDLVTTDPSTQVLTPTQATQVLGTYLRAFEQQSQWRWIDHETGIGVTVTYEAQAKTLWVVLGVGKPCAYTVNAYALTPDQIITRSVTNQDFTGLSVTPQAGASAPPEAESC